MKKIMKLFCVLVLALVLAFTLSGCSIFDLFGDSDSDVVIENANIETEILFSERDYEVDYTSDSYSTIALSDNTSSTADSSVDIDGNIITLSQEGVYVFDGSLSDGQIRVELQDTEKLQIVLEGVSITNSESATIYVEEADKVFITLCEDSENYLNSTIVESANAQELSNIDAVVFSRGDLTINGTGSLTINSTDGNGVTSKDDLTITGGNYVIDSDKNGLEANDSIQIADGTFEIVTSGGYKEILSSSSSSGNSFPGFGDSSSSSSSSSISGCKGIKADMQIYIKTGNFVLDCYDDAIHSDSVLAIDGGDFNITTSDDALHSNITNIINGGTFEIGYCYEAIEGQKITITGGDFNILAADDGVNAAQGDGSSDSDIYIHITGGTLIMDIEEDSEGDGLDSNGEILMSGGYVEISGTTATTDTTLDYDGSSKITGGTFLGAGAEGMTTQNFGSYSTQCSMLVELTRAQTGIIKVSDSSGNVVVSFTPTKEYEILVISSPDFVLGETYTVSAGTETKTVKFSSYINGTGNHDSMSGGMPR